MLDRNEKNEFLIDAMATMKKLNSNRCNRIQHVLYIEQ